jgi:hypothetical protein
LEFQASQKRKRDEAAKQTRIDKIKKQQKIKEALVIGVIVVTALVGAWSNHCSICMVGTE